jgi:hypothetical protein
MLSRKFPTSSENTAELVGQVKFSNLLIVHLQRTAGSEKLQRRSKLYPKGQLRAGRSKRCPNAMGQPKVGNKLQIQPFPKLNILAHHH